jgi:predicted O-methyltransferase YrrM
MNTLTQPRTAQILDQLYAAADAQLPELMTARDRHAHLATATPQQMADALSDYYLPITRDTGTLLYSLVRATQPTTVLEFGTSRGISAIAIAAGLRDVGHGRLITTEMSTVKVAAAQSNFADCGLDDLITVLTGDGQTTIADTPTPNVGMILLDGWKDGYLPFLRLVEPRLVPGAVIVADNASMQGAQDYLDYVRDPANGYSSVNIPVRGDDSVELSVRTAS